MLVGRPNIFDAKAADCFVHHTKHGIQRNPGSIEILQLLEAKHL